MSGNELVVRPPVAEGSLITPELVMDVQEALRRLNALQALISQYLVQDEDYGIIPGTKKPTLLKPGAEKLCDVYALSAMYEVTQRLEDWDKGLFAYEMRCSLASRRSGQTMGQGYGAANSKESRYADRWAPEWKLKKDGIPTAGLPFREKQNDRGAYLEYKILNDDPYTLVNTVLKMAKKRALVDAVLSVTRSSGIFTQDIEDMTTIDPTRVVDTSTGEVKASTQPAARPSPPPVNVTRPAGVAQSAPPTGSPTPDTRPISEPQRKRLFAICKQGGVSEAALAQHIAGLGFVDGDAQPHTSLITRAAYDAICAWAERGGQTPTSPAATLTLVDQIGFEESIDLDDWCTCLGMDDDAKARLLHTPTPNAQKVLATIKAQYDALPDDRKKAAEL